MPAWLISVLENVLPTFIEWIISHYTKKSGIVGLNQVPVKARLTRYLTIKNELQLIKENK